MFVNTKDLHFLNKYITPLIPYHACRGLFLFLIAFRKARLSFLAYFVKPANLTQAGGKHGIPLHMLSKRYVNSLLTIYRLFLIISCTINLT